MTIRLGPAVMPGFFRPRGQKVDCSDAEFANQRAMLHSATSWKAEAAGLPTALTSPVRTWGTLIGSVWIHQQAGDARERLLVFKLVCVVLVS
jgi:hypothetical protein